MAGQGANSVPQLPPVTLRTGFIGRGVGAVWPNTLADKKKPSRSNVPIRRAEGAERRGARSLVQRDERSGFREERSGGPFAMVQAGVPRVGDGANIEHAVFRLLHGDEQPSAL